MDLLKALRDVPDESGTYPVDSGTIAALEYIWPTIESFLECVSVSSGLPIYLYFRGMSIYDTNEYMPEWCKIIHATKNGKSRCSLH